MSWRHLLQEALQAVQQGLYQLSGNCALIILRNVEDQAKVEVRVVNIREENHNIPKYFGGDIIFITLCTFLWKKDGHFHITEIFKFFVFFSECKVIGSPIF